jgi:hypothetical protein
LSGEEELAQIASLLDSADAFQLSLADPKEPQVQLVNYLRRREVLLNLDSFEHLLEGTGIAGRSPARDPRSAPVISWEYLSLRWE